jgi:hypothetical protein
MPVFLMAAIFMQDRYFIVAAEIIPTAGYG